MFDSCQKKKKKNLHKCYHFDFFNELVILLNSTKTPTEVFFNHKN